MVSKAAAARSGVAALLTLFHGLGLADAARFQAVRDAVEHLISPWKVSGAAHLISPGTDRALFNGCQALIQAGLGGVLYFADDAEYNGTISSYYSADVQDVKPSCILKPRSSKDIAKALDKLNSREGRRFPVAVRSGGHAPYPSNNVQDGVVIDLGNLNSIEYFPSQFGPGTVSIGSGSRWGEVYAALEPKGVMVAGGREGHVGVGGFLLGGGFSWYSGKRGMCVDDVVGYEVVLAHGYVTTATAKKNEDLFKALKGGLNNLGVVTKFVVNAFPAHEVYGGLAAFLWDKKDAVVGRFIKMVDDTAKNRAETGFVALSWSPGPAPPNVAFITANVDGETNTTFTNGVTDIGPVFDARAKMPLTGLTGQLASTLGLYNVWYTLSFHNTEDMGRKVTEVFESVVADLQTRNIDEQIQLIFVLTPLPKTFGDKGASTILGLDKMEKNSIVLQPEVIMPSKKYKALLQDKLRAATAEIEAYAKSTGQDTPFRYINYANPEQNPLASYGAENARFLLKTAMRYDASRYLQTAVAGEFKLADIRSFEDVGR